MRLFEVAQTKLQPFSTDPVTPNQMDMMKDPEYMAKKKGMVGKIEWMSPKEYIDKCVAGFRSIGEPGEVQRGRDPKLIKKYAQEMQRGDKFPMLELDYRGGFGQEGLHRAMAAQAIRVEEVPVFVTTESPEFKERREQERKAEMDRIKGQLTAFDKDRQSNLVKDILGAFDESIITEKASRGRPIVCVDVQPAYSGIMDGAEDETFEAAIQFVNDSRAPCLMFVNAEQDGLTSDTVADIKMYWEDSGFDPENWNRVEVYDKGYGYLRSWMDSGIEDGTIVKTIRLLYSQRKNDTRDLEFPPFNKRTPDMAEVMYAVQEMDDDPLIVGWAALDQLKRYNNCYLIGGGRQECLKEVALLMNAFNIKYKMIDDLIYG